MDRKVVALYFFHIIYFSPYLISQCCEPEEDKKRYKFGKTNNTNLDKISEL